MPFPPENSFRYSAHYAAERTAREVTVFLGGLFIYLQSYCPLSDIAPFIFPIVRGTSDLQSFVLNNYLEVNGNVRSLQMLSGLASDTFHRRFKSLFGLSAKQWLLQRDSELIREVASRPRMTATEMVGEVGVPNYTELYRLCRRYYSCTPAELIESLKKCGGEWPKPRT